MRRARRRLLAGSLLGGAAALTAPARAQAPGALAEPGAHASPGPMTLQQCIDDCQRCHAVCLKTATDWVRLGVEPTQASSLALLLDCAELCQTTARSILRGSPMHAIVCGACAQLCEACAEDCEALGAHTQRRRCAAICRECATSCRHMADMAA